MVDNRRDNDDRRQVERRIPPPAEMPRHHLEILIEECSRAEAALEAYITAELVKFYEET